MTRRRLRIILASTLATFTLALAPWAYLRLSVLGDIAGPDGQPRPAQAALVLGARVYPDGTPSKHLAERVDLGVELYRAGLVDTLVMTGNGATPDGWSEPAVMRDRAIAAGVPADAIVLDGEGYDTFASCARAARVYGIETAVVVTQEFHVHRAAWLCQQTGIDATGAYPPIGRSRGTIVGNIREIGASWKAVLNVWTGRVT